MKTETVLNAINLINQELEDLNYKSLYAFKYYPELSESINNQIDVLELQKEELLSQIDQEQDFIGHRG